MLWQKKKKRKKATKSKAVTQTAPHQPAEELPQTTEPEEKEETPKQKKPAGKKCKKVLSPEKAFLDAFGRLTNRYRAWDVWRDFITMFACSLSNPLDKEHRDKREALYLEVIKKYNKQDQELFPELAWIAGREAQRASAVHDQFAQAHGDVADAVLRAFVADGVVVDRAGHARTGGEVQPVLLRAAHFLDDHGHLLLRDEVLRRLDVGPRRREIDRGVDAFDRLEQQAQHLVLVVDVGDHVGRVDAGEGLVVRVFELR